MQVILHKRIKGGWETITADLPPAEVKAKRRQDKATLDRRKVELKAKLLALAAAHPKRKQVEQYPGVYPSNFDVTKAGETIYGHCSGTCSELAKAGVCVACLRREPDCKFCGGTGEWDAPANETPL